MAGDHCVHVGIDLTTGQVVVSGPCFGRNRGMRPDKNAHVSALALIDDHSPSGRVMLRIYHNPDAAVVLRSEVFDGLQVTQHVLPGATTIALDDEY